MKKKILFANPRFHTNLYQTIKVLNKYYYVEMLVANKQIIEDYTILNPTMLKASFLSKILIKIFSKFKKNNRFYFPNFLELFKHLKKSLPTIIILRNYNKIFGLYIIIIAKLLSIKIVFYEQLGKNFFHNNRFKLLFFSIRNFILHSKFYTPIFKNFKKNILFYNFYFIPFLVEIKKKIYKQPNCVKFLFVGKFIPRKNLLLLIKIFSELNKSYNIKLYVVGEVSTKSHSNFFKFIKNKIRFFGVENRIKIIKNLNYKKIFNYYKLCDVLIMPSFNEPASISVMESLGQGTPVICGENNGINFYVKNNFNGLIFNENNEKQLKKKMLFFIKNKKRISIFSKNSYDYFKKNYSEKNFLNQFEKLFK